MAYVTRQRIGLCAMVAGSEDANIRPVESVKSLERGLAVIRAFSASNPRMTLSQVARETGLNRATARRFLHTLVALGYTATDGREFWLRPHVLELGYAYLSSIELPELATPHLKDLVARVNESSSISVLDGTDIIYVARVPTRRIMTVAISLGTRFPAYATSMGRVLLAGQSPKRVADIVGATALERLTPNTITDPTALIAEIDRVREDGWAMVDQELEVGLRSIAAPILDAHGQTIAAINVSASATQGTTADVRKRLLPALLESAADIEQDLRAGSRGALNA